MFRPAGHSRNAYSKKSLAPFWSLNYGVIIYVYLITCFGVGIAVYFYELTKCKQRVKIYSDTTHQNIRYDIHYPTVVVNEFLKWNEMKDGEWQFCVRAPTANRFSTVRYRCILGFHQSYDQTKNRKRSINKFKNQGCDRWLQYKQPRQERGLCCFSFARYLQKCVTQIYRALHGDAMFVPFGGTQTWRV